MAAFAPGKSSNVSFSIYFILYALWHSKSQQDLGYLIVFTFFLFIEKHKYHKHWDFSVAKFLTRSGLREGTYGSLLLTNLDYSSPVHILTHVAKYRQTMQILKGMGNRRAHVPRCLALLLSGFGIA